MRIRIEFRDLVYSFLLSFVMVTILIPTCFLNKIIFLVLILFLLYKISTKKRVLLQTYAPIIIFGIFLYGFLLSFFFPAKRELSIQFFLTINTLFIFYLIDWYKINFDKIIIISGIVFSFITLTIYCVYIYDYDLFQLFIVPFQKYSLGAFGYRKVFTNDTFFFHLGTLPFLYVPFCLLTISIAKKFNVFKLLYLILIAYIILLSGNRGVLVISVIAFLSILYYISKVQFKFIAIITGIPILLFSLYYIINKTAFFNFEEVSNATKIGHLISYLSAFDFFGLIFGKGLASYYYSSGCSCILAHTEITPLDFLRYFGIILTSIIFYLLIFPKFSMIIESDKKIYFILFLLYLLLSATNPVLFNSYGLLIVLWYWSKNLKSN